MSEASVGTRKIAAEPYPFPVSGEFNAAATPLIFSGFQAAPLRETGTAGVQARDTAERLCRRWHAAGGTVILTRRGLPEAAASHAPSAWRNARREVDRTLLLGDRGSALAINSEAAIIVDHVGDNAFLGSDLDHILHRLGAQTVIFGGLATEGTVHATMRAANDRGLDGLLVKDASASTDPAFHNTIVSLTTFGNGLFGAVADAASVERALS